VGNKVHWIKKHGRCKDSTVVNSIKRLYSSTVNVAGFYQIQKATL